MSRIPVVGFVGMTHLGINSAAACAARGFATLGFDPDVGLIERLKLAELPVTEPGLDACIAAVGVRLSFSSDPASLTDCDVVYISADVPTDEQGRSDLSSIRSLVSVAAGCLGPDAVLVVLCQVPPGFTRCLYDWAPERLYYQVETLVFGRALDRAMNPERFIVGCANPATPLHPSYRHVLEAYACPILSMRLESAELAKIAINCCLVASIGVANTLAELCEKLGADWREIAPALKLDARIGPSAYLTPGLGIAGGNLERDLISVVEMSEQFDTDAGIIRALLHNSRHRLGWAVRTLRSALPGAGARLAVWGLAYKENTHSVRNSPSLATLAALRDMKVAVHDPVVSGDVVRHPDLEQAANPLQALDGADALLIMTPWPDYRAISVDEIARRLGGRLVLDPYRVLDRDLARRAGLDYRTLGVSEDF
jgi:UDPglucose 6-dehydrogenase